MKNQDEIIKIEICTFQDIDIVTLSTSGEVDGDETKYTVPDGWLNG